MKLNVPVSGTGSQKSIRAAAIVLLLIFAQLFTVAQTTNAPLRRPVSPSSPMYLMHIDTWNYADPQKIINLIPADLRPYVVMNIGLSTFHDVSPSRFRIAEYGYEVAKSWLRVCAENKMWAMVQVASGGMTQFPDNDLTVYEDLYKNYPNLIGFNYAEQFWGFDDAGDPVSAPWTTRINHFANMLPLSNKYGGYLVVSWCGNQYSANINPIGMLKRNAAFASACRQYTKNYILCEKYTTESYQHDMESLCLGAYLSGFSGNYGIRYDDTGWTDSTGTHTSSSFTMGTYATPFLEHMMLTGQTVVDGPELIWTQCFQETGAINTTNGYATRNWQTFPQFDNVSVDLFRKVLDGSVRIPSRQEVIDRTKVTIVNNVSSGSNDDVYSSPQTLFDELYRINASGTYENNKSFFKKTGRYPTIPTVYQLADAAANTFSVKVNKSEYLTRWPTTAAKVNEFNSLFPAEYTGDIYAGRHENGWVVYNPYKTVQTATGRIPFKYNTTDSMELAFSQYTAGVIKETANQLKIYLNNYDNVINTGLKTDVIKIYGSTSQPTWSYTDRANHQASGLTAAWLGGVFTLTIQHNGPLDITINCAGTATGRLTSYNPATLVTPALPAAYAGPRQYEAEIFDYKNIGPIVKSGYSGSIRNYTGQGYLQFGTNAAAAVRKTVNVLQSGTYNLQTRYVVTGGNVTTIDLYVNGLKVSTPVFAVTPTTSDWKVDTQTISLNAGANTIEFRANAAAANTLYFDNIVVQDAIIINAPRLSANVNVLDGLDYNEGNGPSSSKSITVSGQFLQADVALVAPANYEISLTEASGYTGSIALTRVADSIPVTTLYIRLKAGLVTNTYKGNLTISDNDTTVTVVLTGRVSVLKVYTFTDDVATTSAQTPPAANITVGLANGATAGVVSYTDVNGNTSNYLKAYSGGVRNATAALSLDLFPSSSTDYTVTWKQAIVAPGAGKEYKNGVLLRGTEPAGTATTGYVQGLKQGYLFIVYNPGTANAQFRIYRSTTSGLSMLVNASPATLVPVANKPLWYRAGISGMSPVSMKLEYSTDSITWNTGAQITDATSTYASGATQFVWGLAATSYDFYIDNITLASTPPTADLTLSQGLLTAYNYLEGAGPSASQSFTVSGVHLTDNILVTAPATYEISLSSTSGYTNTLTLPQSSGTLAATAIYARLKAGLAAGDYEGNLTFGYASQSSWFNKPVTLKGSVVKPTIVAVAVDSLSNLDYITGGQPVMSSFIVSGTKLSANLMITAPADAEISLSPNAGYAASLPFAPVNGTVAPVTIYVRLISGLAVGSYSGTLAVTSTGAESKNLAVGGTVFAQAMVNVSATSISGFGYSTFTNIPPIKSFVVYGRPLSGDVTITAPANFEISRSATGGFGASFTLLMSNGTVDATNVFIRLKENLTVNNYQGNVVITSNQATSRLITVSGIVSSNRVYDFTGDVPSTTAQTPPAVAITVGTANGATAGVVSYMDAGSNVSNRFRAYSGGARNATGVMNLELFPADAVDYAVTWKQAVGSNADYKVGVLLRGNNPEGTATTGYVQGLRQGYLFIVYTAKGGATPYTQFRIYPSTAASSLGAYVNNQVNGLNPALDQNMWYRASVVGSNPVNLKFEYSVDSTTWVTAAIATDASATPFLSGSTQLVWGLGSPNFNFFLDEITYQSPVPPTVVLALNPVKPVRDTTIKIVGPKVYPNPARQLFYVLPGITPGPRNRTLVVRLVNSSGQPIFVQTITGYQRGPIPIHSPKPLKAGIYFILINNDKPIKIEIQ
jgi:hypothetical protein